jgi:hypothetical protein
VDLQNRSGLRGEEKNFLFLPGVESRSTSQYPIAIMTELSQLHVIYHFCVITKKRLTKDAVDGVVLPGVTFVSTTPS